MSQPLTGLGSRVAHTAAGTNLGTVTTETVRHAKAHLLDCLGMMFAGRTDRKVLKFRPLSSGEPGPTDLAFGLSLMCGALGLDDFDESTRAHPGAVLVPALLAGKNAHPNPSSARRIGGADFLSGLIVGYQFMGALGKAMGAPQLHSRGYHPSSILGAPSAALAVGRMLALPEDELANSVGIGASLACGTTEFDAEDEMRSVQTAWAASSGLAAIRLASLGYRASDAALDARNGLISRTAPGFVASPGDWMGGEPGRVQLVSYKPYPHFSDLHPATSALLMILSEQRIHFRDVAGVTVRVSEAIAERLHTAYPPTTGREAKRSTEFVMATALISAVGDGSTGSFVGAFGDSALEDELTVELGRCVSLRKDLPVSDSGPQAIVEVHMRDGTYFSREAHGYPGDGRRSDLRWGWDDVRLRFDQMVEPVLGSSLTGSIAEFVLVMNESPDVSDDLERIIALLLPSSSS